MPWINGMDEIEKVIEISNLSFAYSNIPVLCNINLTIRRGDYVGMIGSNGAGKSTLLKLILGLLKPAGGTIRLLGKEISELKNFRKIGYLPQNSASLSAGFPATAEEIVRANLFSKPSFPNFHAKKQAPLVKQALETVGMQDYAKRMIGEMSGGQQQRIMLARVLAPNPDVLLLDEPVTGIDADAAEELYALLEKLNTEQNITVIMITHDTERASRSAKHILHLNGNGILEESHHVGI